MDWLIRRIGDRIPEPRSVPEKVYIRFGLWEGRSKNYLTGEKEQGVSVYPAKLVSERTVQLDTDIDIPWHLVSGRLVFPVTGTEVGTGSDGEPVLRNVKLIPYAVSLENLDSFRFETRFRGFLGTKEVPEIDQERDNVQNL